MGGASEILGQNAPQLNEQLLASPGVHTPSAGHKARRQHVVPQHSGSSINSLAAEFAGMGVDLTRLDRLPARPAKQKSRKGRDVTRLDGSPPLRRPGTGRPRLCGTVPLAKVLRRKRPDSRATHMLSHSLCAPECEHEYEHDHYQE